MNQIVKGAPCPVCNSETKSTENQGKVKVICPQCGAFTPLEFLEFIRLRQNTVQGRTEELVKRLNELWEAVRKESWVCYKIFRAMIWFIEMLDSAAQWLKRRFRRRGRE